MAGSAITGTTTSCPPPYLLQVYYTTRTIQIVLLLYYDTSILLLLADPAANKSNINTVATNNITGSSKTVTDNTCNNTLTAILLLPVSIASIAITAATTSNELHYVVSYRTTSTHVHCTNSIYDMIY